MSLVSWTNWEALLTKPSEVSLASLIVVIQEVKRFANQFQFPAIPGDQAASQSKVGRA
jgi:hypothetical protein